MTVSRNRHIVRNVVGDSHIISELGLRHRGHEDVGAGHAHKPI